MKTALAVVGGLFGVIGATWGAASTITENRLRGIVIEVVQSHDQNPTPHSAMAARYPSPAEHAKAEKAAVELLDEFREFKDNAVAKLEILALGQERIEGRLKAQKFIRDNMPKRSRGNTAPASVGGGG